MIFVSTILRNRRMYANDRVALNSAAHPDDRQAENGVSSARQSGQELAASRLKGPSTGRPERHGSRQDRRVAFWHDPTFFERIEAELAQAPLSSIKELERIQRAHRHWCRIQAVQKSTAVRAWHAIRACLQMATSRVSFLLMRFLAWNAARLLQLVLSQLSLGRLSRRRARSLARWAKRLNRASFVILRWQLPRSVQYHG
jgi:hypothetical protein